MRIRSGSTSTRAAMFLAAAFLAVSTGSAFTAAPAAAEGSQVIALVASNAKGAFGDIQKAFEAQHKGVTIEPQWLGSSAIAKMVDEQQPADFALVGDTAITKVTQLIDTPVPVLQNKEIILVPKDNPAHIKTLKDLANDGVKLSVGTPKSAVGKLAGDVMQKAAQEYGFDFINNFRKNITVQSEKGSDVVGALTTGKANAAIAFASDYDPAKFGGIPIEDKFNIVSTYVVLVPKNSKNADMGKALEKFVAGSEGQAILKKWRYMAPPAK